MTTAWRRRVPMVLIALAILAAACADGGGSEAIGPLGDGADPSDGGEVETPSESSGDDRDVVEAGDVELTFEQLGAAPEFPDGLDWFNVERPLSMAQDLRGKVVVLDFWTQGCINCLHVIPDLHRLEEEYPDELVVVGVHWAKFTRESERDAVAAAVLRNGVVHPVVNDADQSIARAYGARAWPTLVAIDPDGQVLGVHAGEGAYDVLQPVVDTVAREFDALGRLDTRPLDAIVAEPVAPTVLSFPGELHADEATDRLFIADSGNHRILEATLDGELLRSFGTGEAGLTDGAADEAQFRRPQGLDLSADGRTLWVADRENHAVRAIDLETGRVRTVAGTGEQSYQVADGVASATAVPSPWDVLEIDGWVYVAGAGRHQIYRLDPVGDVFEVYAGTGAEGLDDGPRLETTLSQPSGLATDGEALFFTDPEASAVRRIDLTDGVMQTLVGEGLFVWGDTDGPLAEARIQHASGIAAHNGRLLLADTYNHAIKFVDVEADVVARYAGSDQGLADGVGTAAQFAEPNGISVADGVLYVADTNNHQIRTVDLSTAEVGTIAFANLDVAAITRSGVTGDRVEVAPQTVAPGSVELAIDYGLPEGYKLNTEGTFTLEWSATDDGVVQPAGPSRVEAQGPSLPVRLALDAVDGSTVIEVTSTVYYCLNDNEAFCLIRDIDFVVPVEVEPGGATVVEASHDLPSGEDLGITS